MTVTVPQSQGLLIPVTLPIGTNRPNVYMGFGDSITIGEGSPDNRGYRPGLEDRLAGALRPRQRGGEGVDATRSNRGAERIDDSLSRARPAYTLILYGTNDFNVRRLQGRPALLHDRQPARHRPLRARLAEPAHPVHDHPRQPAMAPCSRTGTSGWRR